MALGFTGCSLVGEADIETEAATAAVNDIIEGARPNLDDFGLADLDRCPFDPGGSLLTQAVTEVADNDDVLVARSAELAPAVYEASPEIPLMVACDRFNELSGVGLVVASAPDDFDRFVEIFAQGSDETTSHSVERLGSTDHRGGTLHRVCAESLDESDTEDGAISYCEIDWVDENLMVTVYVSGPKSLDVDLDALEAGLVSVLEDVVSNLDGPTA